MMRVICLTVCLWSGLAPAQSTYQGMPDWNRVRPPSLFFGTWGNRTQCDAGKTSRLDDFRMQPYRLSDEWLQHGFLYCFVGWRAYRQHGDRHLANVWLRCGEDTVRRYDAVLSLSDDRLTIRWSRDFTTRALERCDG